MTVAATDIFCELTQADPHSPLGTTSLAGVLAAKAAIERFGLPGTLLLFGGPAGALLDRVERGEEIVITRRGKPVAKLVPAEPSFDRTSARRAVAGLLEANRGVTLGGLKIKELISEGRS